MLHVSDAHQLVEGARRFGERLLSFELDVSADVEKVLNDFNQRAEVTFGTTVTSRKEGVPWIFSAYVLSLNRADRDTFESIIEQWGHWAIWAGDRRFLQVVPEELYPETATLKLKYLVNSGRYCSNCQEFTTFHPNLAVWSCSNCGRCVGVHTHTDIALGSIADAVTRQRRVEVHKSVDRIWHEELMGRGDVYKEMSALLQTPAPYTHIAMLDNKQCSIVSNWAKALYKERTGHVQL